MAISSERIKQDLLKIEALSKATTNKVKVKEVLGNPTNVIILELDYPTAPSQDYPNKVQKQTILKIELLSRYPFQEPSATITTPIFHPNVYRSGKVCLGTKWLATQGLDLLIKRIIQIITFDPLILNEQSPANGEALSWYRTAASSYPSAFPTDKLILDREPENKMVWNEVSNSSNDKVIVNCPTCSGASRVPKGRSLNITCPKCSNTFRAQT